MALHQGAKLPQIQGGGIVHLHHSMGIAHGHRIDCTGDSLDSNCHRLSKLRDAHAHHRPGHRAAADEQGQLPIPRRRLDGEVGPVRQPLVIDVFAEAADAVAAHGPLGAVGVEHPHPEIRPPGRADADDPVPAHAEVAVGQAAGQRARVLRHPLQAVEENIVVAQAVHFGKAHTLPSLQGNVCAWIVPLCRDQ